VVTFYALGPNGELHAFATLAARDAWLAEPGAVGRTPVQMRDWRQRRLVRERERERQKPGATGRKPG
jgi:hypothetical protein